MKRTSTVFEVDQSIKIGDLSADTILAYSNHTCGTVRIPVDVKRKALQALRRRGKSTIRATVQVFAAGLFLLLQGVVERASLIVIDTEYTGYEDDIRGMLVDHFRESNMSIYPELIAFQPIGKASRAHARAASVHRGVESVGKTITMVELSRILRGLK